MSLDERISNLIKRIYCAGPDAHEWDRVAIELLSVTGGTGALTSVTDLTNRELTSYRAYGPENSKFARGIEEYSERYLDDPSLKWGFENPAARFCDSSATLSAEEYGRNEYVSWNLDRFGSTHWYVGYTRPEEDLSFTFSLHFPAAQGPGSEHSLQLFRMLFDHMECAVRLQRRPFNHDSNRCLIVVSSTGSVQQLTAAADKLLSGGGLLAIVDGRLTTANSANQSKLDTALSRVLSVVETGFSPVALKIDNAPGEKPWLLTMRPLVQSYGPLGRMRCDVLVEIHGSASRLDNLEVLQSLFDLTARELQIVRMLAGGHSIDSLASAMKISPNTVRTHLRSIFSKTSTTRQSELILLCATVARS